MRSYGEVIDVRTAPSLRRRSAADARGGAPEQFLWRGRIYLVRDVLAHWVELGAWWVAPGRSRRAGTGPPAPARRSTATRRHRARWPPTSARSSARCGASRPPPGRSASPGVYDLVRDVPAAPPATPRPTSPTTPTAPGMRPGGHRPDVPPRWRLARALD